MRFDPFYPESAADIAHTAKERRYIPDEVFPIVREWAYTPTADFILSRYGPRGLEILLAMRKEPPWAGEWWMPGGQIRPGETPEDGLVRNCERELGFAPAIGDTRFLGWHSIYNPECAHGGKAYFTMSGCWQVWVDLEQEIKPDGLIETASWFTLEELKNRELSVYVKNMVDKVHREPGRLYSSTERN